MLSASLLLVACATSPVATDGEEIAPVGPAHVLEDQSLVGELVVWGGRIVEVENRADRTLLVVASLPLDRADRPRLHYEPGVRFIAEQPGYLEPLTFAPGRFVTILGTVSGTRIRAVGDYDYLHPTMDIEKLHLWPSDPMMWSPHWRWNFGIGIRL
ncbi:Slp family lipoprotein [Wenzhouxiangella marina]|uniref:Slp family lipoprotein n=1 Tax=Wenzhouxiangella marina TaxID=1579979 RepID=UPI00067340A6|nr:Slp family lipoprotein [Wenzhouxiangella marina]MBB6086161.1 outer membrane lipoprotein [Wenzhouxiangella marina]